MLLRSRVRVRMRFSVRLMSCLIAISVVFCQGVNAEAEIKSGDAITVTIDDQYQEACTKDLLWLDYKNLVQVIEPGKRILIDDGNLSLIVQDKGRSAWCQYTAGRVFDQIQLKLIAAEGPS